MSRLQFGLLILLGLALCVTVGPGGADEPKVKGFAIKQMVYLARNVPPADLARALNAHFKTTVEAVVVSEKTSNALLITVTTGSYDELIQTLETLDAKPASIEVEVTVLEVRADGKEGPAKIDEADLSGPSDKVAAKIQSLRKAGVVGTVRQFKLTTLENQRATSRMGEDKPFVVGTTGGAFGGRGSTQQMINYRQLGTTLGVKPRLAAGAVVVEIELDDAGFGTDTGASVGTDENGKSLPAPAFTNSRLQTTVRIPTGSSVLAKGVKTEAKGSDAQTLVVLSARNLDAAPVKK